MIWSYFFLNISKLGVKHIYIFNFLLFTYVNMLVTHVNMLVTYVTKDDIHICEQDSHTCEYGSYIWERLNRQVQSRVWSPLNHVQMLLYANVTCCKIQLTTGTIFYTNSILLTLFTYMPILFTYVPILFTYVNNIQ